MEVRGRYYSCFVSDVDLVGDVSVGWTTAICSVRVCTTNPRISIVDPTFFFASLLGNNVSPPGSFTFHSNHVDAEKKTVATARPTILPPSAVRSNANNPTDDPHLALHARTRSMARSPNDPRRRRMAHHDTAGAHARERDSGDGRLGRCALDARA